MSKWITNFRGEQGLLLLKHPHDSFQLKEFCKVAAADFSINAAHDRIPC